MQPDDPSPIAGEVRAPGAGEEVTGLEEHRAQAFPALILLFLGSGLAALVYEVVWMRRLVLVLGASELATTVILASFMGGLALGSWSGRWAHRLPPLRAYALLEAAIGVYALLFLPLLNAVTPALVDLGRAMPSLGLRVGAQGGVLVLLLLPATAAMGATLPLLSQALSSEGRRGAFRVGVLYSANTMGAVLGVALAGFVLLPALGVTRTEAILGCTNLGLAALAWSLARRHPVVDAQRSSGGGSPRGSSERLALGVVCLSGWVGLVLEVAWTRFLVLQIGSSVYAFAILLLTFLSGIALGSAAGARLVRREGVNCLRALAVLLLLAAAGTALTTRLLGTLPFLFVTLWRWMGGADVAPFAIGLILSGLVMVPATLAFGAMFPLAVGASECPSEGLGGVVARLYSGNTVAAILGSVAAGFFLIPHIGVLHTIELSVSVLLLGSVALCWLGAMGGRAVALSSGCAALLAGQMFALPPAWDPLIVSAGMYKYVSDLGQLNAQGLRAFSQEGMELLYFKEGFTTTVTVARIKGSGTVWLANNGKVDASTDADMPTQVLLGQLPFLFSSSPQRVLVVGMASGVTAGSVLSHPIKELDIVELEPIVVEASHYFDHENGRPMDDARVRVIADDARNHILRSREPYDIIISEPSNPWISGVSNLFTREFFELGREALVEGGLWCQWVQLYGMDRADLKSLLATVQSVFPEVQLFNTLSSTDLLLVGSTRPLRLRPESMATLEQDPQIRRWLLRVGMASPGSLLAAWLMGPEGVASFSEGGLMNTDDNLRIEFDAPRNLHYNTHDANIEAIAALARLPYAAMEQAWGEQPEELLRRLRSTAQIYEDNGLTVLSRDAWLKVLDREPEDERAFRSVVELEEELRVLLQEPAASED